MLVHSFTRSLVHSLARRLVVVAFAFVFAPNLLATDWYVDSLLGNDNFVGSAASPFKSIKKALLSVDDGDTVYIRYGTGKYNNDPFGSNEAFPLRADKKRIKLIGQRQDGQLPRISAYYNDPVLGLTSYSAWPPPMTPLVPNTEMRYMFLLQVGWELHNLIIENKDYDKSPPLSTNEAGRIVGIGIWEMAKNLTAGNFQPIIIQNCTVDDNWAGIHVLDRVNANDPPNGPYPIGREVRVISTDVINHGPLTPNSSFLTDAGHQGVLLQTYNTFTFAGNGSNFINNHDGIESGNGDVNEASISVDDCDFLNNENGLEVPGGVFNVTNCLFRRNEALGTQFGGTDTATSAVSFRGFAPQLNISMTVRNTRFEHNQHSVKTKDIPATKFDFGTSASPGNNVFLFNPRNPWSASGNPAVVSYATDKNVSHVSVAHLHPTVPLQMVGNRWSYLACSVVFSQDVCMDDPMPFDPIGGTFLGSFECFSSKIFSAGTSGLNLDGGGQPNKRPTVGGAGAENTCTTNNPFNFSIAPNAADIIVK